MRLAVIAALVGCSGLDDGGGTWMAADAIDGALAVELGPAPAMRERAPVLRVASWNVHFGANAAALADELRADPELARADVLLVQEIEAYPHEPATRTRQLAEALAMTWVYAPARTEGDGTHGIAVLSRYPLVGARVLALPHAESPWNERDRIALAVDVELGDVRVPVVNVHLDVRISAADRVRQLHPALIDAPSHAIVGGDFNTNPYAWVGGAVPLTSTQAVVGHDQAMILDDYLHALGFVGALAADVNTLNVAAISARLDNVYARGFALGAASVATGVDGSDHRPVWTDVHVPAAAMAPGS